MDQILAYLARYFFPWAEQPKKGLVEKLFSGISGLSGMARIIKPSKPAPVSTPENSPS